MSKTLKPQIRDDYPEEPTAEMLMAGARHTRTSLHDAKEVYKAMRAAYLGSKPLKAVEIVPLQSKTGPKDNSTLTVPKEILKTFFEMNIGSYIGRPRTEFEVRAENEIKALIWLRE